MEIERGTCAYCDFVSDYVLTVTDPAPDPEKVIDGPVAMPVCYDHYEDLKEADLNKRADNGEDLDENE